MSPTELATVALPPGPPAHPLTGNLRELGADRPAFLQHRARTCGDFVPLRLLRGAAILLNRPGYIEEVLVTQKRHFILALAPDQRIEMEPSVTLRPKHGLKMEVLAR